MGTDINAIFQKRVMGKWEVVDTNYAENRHYSLFAHLAGVRNGYGFAGVSTGQPITPISDPRGLPEEFEINECGEVGGYSLGYHDHSWLTAEEILSHKYGGEWRTGVVDLDVFNDWDGVTAPNGYSGGVFGANVHIANNPCEVSDNTTHVRVFWRQDSKDFDYFLDEIKRLQNEHGEVRMVFGFDS